MKTNDPIFYDVVAIITNVNVLGFLSSRLTITLKLECANFCGIEDVNTKLQKIFYDGMQCSVL